MMGPHDRSEALFYYFRLEDQVTETNLLRLIETHISFAFVRERLKASYSDTGRPSIDPELQYRNVLTGTTLNPKTIDRYTKIEIAQALGELPVALYELA